MKNKNLRIWGMLLSVWTAFPLFAQEVVETLSPVCDITLRSDNPDKAFPYEAALEMYTVRQTTKYVFPHPCAMYSAADFSRVKASLHDATAPDAVKQEFQTLMNSSYASLSRTPSPQEVIVRGDVAGTGLDKENYSYAMRDAAAAYQTALLWKLTADEAYAKKSIEILNAWAATCKRITANDANMYLAAGAQGYTFANAAEIMQTYSGWNKTELAAFKQWMLDVFAVKNRDFLDNHVNSSNCSLHYWSNWDLVNMASYLAIGILTEDCDMVDYVVNYFYEGAGNGCIRNLVQATFSDPLNTGEQIAQDQESGRDQGHAQMSAMVVANLAQMAYTFYSVNKRSTDAAKLDFFAADDNALMKLGEYVALSNLRNGTDNANKEGEWFIAAKDMPFQKYVYCSDCTCKNKNHGAIQTVLADNYTDPSDGRVKGGRGDVRPGWEIFYNHYAKVKGLSSGFTYAKQMADKLRPECGAGDSRYGSNSGAFDQLGWSTLMLYR